MVLIRHWRYNMEQNDHDALTSDATPDQPGDMEG